MPTPSTTSFDPGSADGLRATHFAKGKAPNR